MDKDTSILIDRWIIAFREPPVLVDVELMRQMLAEAEGSGNGEH